MQCPLCEPKTVTAQKRVSAQVTGKKQLFQFWTQEDVNGKSKNQPRFLHTILKYIALWATYQRSTLTSLFKSE